MGKRRQSRAKPRTAAAVSDVLATYVEVQRKQGIPEPDVVAAACWARWLGANLHERLADARQEAERCERASRNALDFAFELSVSLKVAQNKTDQANLWRASSDTVTTEDNTPAELKIDFGRLIEKLQLAAAIFQPPAPLEPMAQALRSWMRPDRDRIHHLFEAIRAMDPGDNPSPVAMERLSWSLHALAVELKARAIALRSDDLIAAPSRPGRPVGILPMIAEDGARAGLTAVQLARVGLKYGFDAQLDRPASEQQARGQAPKDVDRDALEKLRQRLQNVWPARSSDETPATI